MTEKMWQENPFRGEETGEASDRELAAAAVGGDRGALETLVERHQPWIYNLAFRMVLVPDEASDVTQDVLVKILTKLASYDPEKGAFRTWLYRIVTNHVLNMKTRGYEAHITGFDSYYDFVDQIPDQDPGDSPELELMAQDLKIGCVMGTLLCLDRTQRMVFILAVAFGATDAVGSEVLGMSRDAFRKNLSRARGKLRQYMTGKCGVVNPEAPCRCRKKIKTFVDSGAYTLDRLNFLSPDRPTMEAMMEEVGERFSDEVLSEYRGLFLAHPFYEGEDRVPWLRELLQGPEMREIFHLG